ncbi:MAG: hypothetical protein SGJ27_17620 [Candidatus Melainabacteria bacterium]|nr:hypothetical protein [Candidatus Melainabacteria bacterium]
MKLEDILRQFTDNAALRLHAAQLKRESMALWVASTEQPDRKNHIACIRADILTYACDLRDLLAALKCSGVPIELSHSGALSLQVFEEQVAIEMRTLEIVLTLLTSVESIVVDDRTSAARANFRLSQCSRLFEMQRANATSANTLAVLRELIT